MRGTTRPAERELPPRGAGPKTLPTTVYDAAGQRVRKVTERAGTATRDHERVYLGAFEISASTARTAR